MAQGGASAELAALFARRRSKLLGDGGADAVESISEERDEQGSGVRNVANIADSDADPSHLQAGDTTGTDTAEASKATSDSNEDGAGAEEADGPFIVAATLSDTHGTKLQSSRVKSLNEAGEGDSDGGSTRIDGGSQNVLAEARRKLRPTPSPCPKNRYQSPVSVGGTSGNQFETPPRRKSTSRPTCNDPLDAESEQAEISHVSTGEGEDGRKVKGLVNQWASKTEGKVTSTREVPISPGDDSTAKFPSTPQASLRSLITRTNSSPVSSSVGTPASEYAFVVKNAGGNSPFDEPRTTEQGDVSTPLHLQTEPQSHTHGDFPTKSSPGDNDAGRDISNLLMKVDEFTSRSNNLIFDHGKTGRDYDNDVTGPPMKREKMPTQPKELPSRSGPTTVTPDDNAWINAGVDNNAGGTQPNPNSKRYPFNEKSKLQYTPTRRPFVCVSPHGGDNKATKENRTNPSPQANRKQRANDVVDRSAHAKLEISDACSKEETTTPRIARRGSSRRSPMGSLSLQVLEDELDEVVAQANMNELDGVVAAQAGMAELDVVVARASSSPSTRVATSTLAKAKSKGDASLGNCDSKKRRSSRSRVSASPSPQAKDKTQRNKSVSPIIPVASKNASESQRSRGGLPTPESPIKATVKRIPSVDSITCEIRVPESRASNVPVNNVPVNPPATPSSNGGKTAKLVENDSSEVDSIYSDDVTVKQGNTRRVSRSVSPFIRKKIVVDARPIASIITPRRGSAFKNAGRGGDSPPRATGRAGTNDNLVAENKRLREELVKITTELGVKDAIIADLKKRLEKLQPETRGKDVEEEILQSILKQKKFVPTPRRRANQDENERRFLC